MPRSIDADFNTDASGALMVPTELEYVRQRVVQRLRFILGESFRRPDAGLPYEADTQYADESPERLILGTFNSPELAIGLISSDLPVSVPEITGVEVDRSSLDRRTRLLMVRLRISTIYGDTDLEVGL